MGRVATVARHGVAGRSTVYPAGTFSVSSGPAGLHRGGSPPFDSGNLDRLGDALERHGPGLGRSVPMSVRIEGRLAGQDLADVGKGTDAGRRVNATAAPIPSAAGRFGDAEPDADARRETVLAPTPMI